MEFGCTLSNTPGIDGIAPKLLGMKGQVLDFNKLEFDESTNDIRPKMGMQAKSANKRRVDLATVPSTDVQLVVPTLDVEEAPGDFIKLDVGEGQDFEALNLNHKIRRKVRRAYEAAEIQKELLVRKRVRDLCEEQGAKVPAALSTPAKAIHEKGQRLLDNGLLETSKGERVRQRVELAEFNKAARVLRKQAKQIALEAGLRVHAEMTSKISPSGNDGGESNANPYGQGWHLPRPPESK